MRKPQRGLRQDRIVGMRITGYDKRLPRCLDCKATPSACNASGCNGGRKPDWRRVQPA